VIAAIAGAALILLVLWETFETLVLPRRVARRLRLTRVYYRMLWGAWSRIGRRHPGPRRENYLSVFAPLSLLLLFVIWGIGVIVGFALIQWGLHTNVAPEGEVGFGTYLYLSATTFVTLGLGDVAPTSSAGRVITAMEAGAGFAFLALSISYLPVLYQSFSRREVGISMLDQWAGSPPTAVELLRRAAAHGELASVDDLLGDWERWSAELLESHLSIRSWRTSARSTTSSRGSPRSPRCSTPPRSCSPGSTACPTGRRAGPSRSPGTRSST
jgi:hypothetical protein